MSNAVLFLKWLRFRWINLQYSHTTFHVKNSSWERYKTVYAPGFCGHPYPMTEAQKCWAILNRMKEKRDNLKL